MLELRPHQVEGRDFLRTRENGRAALLDEAGSGKTPQLLAAAEGATLVVAPAMVLDSGTWANEAARWRPDLEMATTSYHALTERVDSGRLDKNNRPIMVYGTRARQDLRQRWDTIILDEAHHLKGRKSVWTGPVEQLCKKAGQVFMATGTPIPNWAYELYTLLRILHPTETAPGKRFGAYWRWAETWFPVGPQYSRKGKLLTTHHVSSELRACDDDCESSQTCKHWTEFREANFEGMAIGRSWDDLGYSLPPLMGWETDDRQPILFRVKMTPEQKRVYQQLKKEYVAWADDGTQIEAWSQAGLQTRLRQVSVGLEVADPSLCGSGKLDAMQELLANRSLPTVVVGHHLTTLDAIKVRCAKLGMETREISGRTTSKVYRRKTIEDFQAGRFPILVAQIDTIAEGLTLTRADTIILVEHSFRPHINVQVVRKLWRLGQTRPVTVIRLATDHSLDGNIIELLGEKTEHQLRAMPPKAFAALL